LFSRKGMVFLSVFSQPTGAVAERSGSIPAVKRGIVVTDYYEIRCSRIEASVEGSDFFS